MESRDQSEEKSPLESKTVEIQYPDVSDRVKAVFADNLILTGLLIGLSMLFSELEMNSTNVKKATFFTLFVLYDPLCTALLGGTLGHHMNGLKVVRAHNHKKKVFILLAFVRYIFKATLGIISLLTISGSKKRQAIHDSFAATVVIYNDKKNSNSQ